MFFNVCLTLANTALADKLILPRVHVVYTGRGTMRSMVEEAAGSVETCA